MTKSKKSKKQNDVQEEDWSLDDSQLYELLKSMYWENGIAQNKNRFKNEFMGKNQIKDKEFYRRWFNENAMSWDDWWDFFSVDVPMSPSNMSGDCGIVSMEKIPLSGEIPCGFAWFSGHAEFSRVIQIC